MINKTRFRKYKNDKRIRQGDIIGDVRYFESFKIDSKVLELNYIDFPYVYVITQECDLDLEKASRGKELKNNNGNIEYDDNSNPIIDVNKSLVSVLVAPIYNFDIFSDGVHLVELCKKDKIDPNTYKVNPLSKKDKKKHKENKYSRYHYLEFNSTTFSPSIIDFKHYFSINLEYLEELKKSNYVFTVDRLFREQISLRFACFLARIGLPVVK